MERRQLFGGALAAVLAPVKARRRHVALWPEYTDLAQLLAGTNFVINAKGQFFYSGPPAAGNLAVSITNSSGTDPFGNAYLDGVTRYTFSSLLNTFFAAQLSAELFQSTPGLSLPGVIFWFSATETGPWTHIGEVLANSTTSVALSAGGSGSLSVSSGGLTDITGRVLVNDSGSGFATSGDLEIQGHGMIAMLGRATPASPPAGYGFLYVHSTDGSLHYKSAAGTDTLIAPG